MSTPKTDFFSYMRGWRIAAGNLPFTDLEMEDEQFRSGYEEGRAVCNMTREMAEKRYGVKDEIVRAQRS